MPYDLDTQRALQHKDLSRSLSPRPIHRRLRSRSPSHDARSARPSDRERGPRESKERDEGRHRSSRSHRHRAHEKPPSSAALPFSARPLSKSDYVTFRPLFAYYLSIQKQIELDDLDERESRGRWKSFLGKWNRGELAEGWYDPEMFERVAATAPEPTSEPKPIRESDGGKPTERPPLKDQDDDVDMDESDDDYGPVLPSSGTGGRRAGPGIPSLQDLTARNEMDAEDREQSLEDLRYARKADRALQKERLDELVPRADAGTRERKLEKRQMVNDKMRDFREKSPGMEGGNENDLMGGGDSLEEYKKMKEKEQKKKTAREIRREEIERAKREEMEERRAAWKEREEGTISMLRELAKQRFG